MPDDHHPQWMWCSRLRPAYAAVAGTAWQRGSIPGSCGSSSDESSESGGQHRRSVGADSNRRSREAVASWDAMAAVAHQRMQTFTAALPPRYEDSNPWLNLVLGDGRSAFPWQMTPFFQPAQAWTAPPPPPEFIAFKDLPAVERQAKRRKMVQEALHDLDAEKEDANHEMVEHHRAEPASIRSGPEHS